MVRTILLTAFFCSFAGFSSSASAETPPCHCNGETKTSKCFSEVQTKVGFNQAQQKYEEHEVLFGQCSKTKNGKALCPFSPSKVLTCEITPSFKFPTYKSNNSNQNAQQKRTTTLNEKSVSANDDQKNKDGGVNITINNCTGGKCSHDGTSGVSDNSTPPLNAATGGAAVLETTGKTADPTQTSTGNVDKTDPAYRYEKDYTKYGKKSDDQNNGLGVTTRQQKREMIKGINGTMSDVEGGLYSGKVNQNDYNESRVIAQQSKKEIRKEYKENKRAAKQASKDAAIMEKNRTGEYGGKYGGFNKETTLAVNESSKIVGTVTRSYLESQMANNNSDTYSQLALKGYSATQKDAIEAQAKTFDNAEKSAKNIGGVLSGITGVQGAFIAAHMASKNKVGRTANSAIHTTETEYKNSMAKLDEHHAACLTTATGNQVSIERCDDQYEQKKTAVADLYDNRMDNISTNESSERKAQGDAALQQSFAVAATAAQATMAFAQARQAKEHAEMLRNLVPAEINPNQPVVDFRPRTQVQRPDEGPYTPTQEAETTAVTADEDAGDPFDPGFDPFNPNMGDGGVGGPTPGDFVASAPPPPGGGSAGLGGTGGTSAAKEEGQEAETMAVKNQAGTYSTPDSAPLRYARGGDGPGVGVDPNFSDLLKQFLPGAEEKKPGEDELAFDENRNPASDSAAVLGRNQNIFEAIHKRYQKKHSEGAVALLNDQS